LILLDTPALLWLATEPGRLSRRAASAIRRARSSEGIGIASISLREMAVLFARGRVRASGTIDASVRMILETTGAAIKEITPEIAAVSTQFPDDYPRDPADRLIGATARAEGLMLVTRDEAMRASPLIRTIW
jgi:PIN domain nuclease of toxin-antitoxin system